MRILLLLLLAFSIQSKAALLITEEYDEDQRDESSIKTSSRNGIEMRTNRRVGIGLSAAGVLGFAGLNLELNFTPRWGIQTGFGGGPGYQAFNVGFKRVLAGESFLPYMSFGFARWSNFEPKGPVRETNPAFLSEKFMTREDREAGKISENLLYPGIGVQYVQLNGPYSGLSVFAEVVMLLDVNDFEAAPTGSAGVLYYF